MAAKEVREDVTQADVLAALDYLQVTNPRNFHFVEQSLLGRVVVAVSRKLREPGVRRDD
jgi:hypothetical protein